MKKEREMGVRGKKGKIIERTHVCLGVSVCVHACVRVRSVRTCMYLYASMCERVGVFVCASVFVFVGDVRVNL